MSCWTFLLLWCNLCNIKPDWNDYMAEHHSAAREAFKRWTESGWPRQGPLFAHKKYSNSRFNAFCLIKTSSQWELIHLPGSCMIIITTSAKKRQCWTTANVQRMEYVDQVKWLSFGNSIIMICSTVWKNNLYNVDKVDLCENIVVRPEEIYHAILKLSDNKACGTDHITTEQLKHASQTLHPLLIMCFTGFLINGILPHSVKWMLLVPVIKEKTL